MNNFIVTTTINKTTLALKKYSNLKNWKLIVVGDQKTPHNYYKNNKKIIYLTPNDQEKLDIKLSNLIGWNCIARRNFGFIDDDNIPYNNWGKKIYLNKIIRINYYKTNNIAFDPICIFRFKEKIWHRGYPLQLINLKNQFNKSRKKEGVSLFLELFSATFFCQIQKPRIRSTTLLPKTQQFILVNIVSKKSFASLKNPQSITKREQ